MNVLSVAGCLLSARHDLKHMASRRTDHRQPTTSLRTRRARVKVGEGLGVCAVGELGRGGAWGVGVCGWLVASY